MYICFIVTMASKRVTKRKNNRNHPYIQSDDSTRVWTNKHFKEELQKLGIKTPKGMSKTILKQLYEENSKTNTISQENSILEISCNTSDQTVSENRCLTNTETTVRSDLADITAPQAESSSVPPTSPMNDQLTSVVNTLCQNFQDTITKIITNNSQTLNTSTKEPYNLHNWYMKERSANDQINTIPNIPRTAVRSDDIVTSQGVRSDSYSHVDNIAPSLQRQI